jgi:hypothetical protein
MLYGKKIISGVFFGRLPLAMETTEAQGTGLGVYPEPA